MKNTTLLIIAVVVIVLGVLAYFLLNKKTDAITLAVYLAV